MCIVGRGYSIIKDKYRFSSGGVHRGGDNDETDTPGTEGLDYRVEEVKTRWRTQ